MHCRRPNMKQARGFTLIELMIVVAIVAILAAIAYPSYTNYVLRTRRADGKEFLMRVAAAQERRFTNLNRYGSMADLGLGTSSENGYYTVDVALANGDQTYTLTAAPQGAQAPDQCGNLTLTNTGFKGQSGTESNGKCW
ncbi:MAG: prepilin-type N-terminal cleavage/methylation domain-containing protein [Dokdonella sp.]|nr:MAG: prepilin-type N-terminal cleavage/methylation domain-containing protein [Dokdonella sp.]